MIGFMADKIKVWFDAEADFLEVRFSDAAGYEKETKHDAVMERVDAAGHVIGFSVMGVSKHLAKPLKSFTAHGVSKISAGIDQGVTSAEGFLPFYRCAFLRERVLQ
jgi:uncharacterized protein YuzE